jgi:hypothetical protein
VGAGDREVDDREVDDREVDDREVDVGGIPRMLRRCRASAGCAPATSVTRHSARDGSPWSSAVAPHCCESLAQDHDPDASGLWY